MSRAYFSSLVAALLCASPFFLSGCAKTPARAPTVAQPPETLAAPLIHEAPAAPPAAMPVPEVVATPVAEPPPPEPEPPESPGPPPDLAFSMAADDTGPPAEVNARLSALVARLKKGNNLSLRLTLFAPPVASREYALGLAAKASETLRRHLRGLGVPPRKIIRVVIDPRRTTVSADERINVEVRLIGDK